MSLSSPAFARNTLWGSPFSFLQQTLVTLNQCARRAGLTIIGSKREALKFRVEGRLPRPDEFRLEGQQTKPVNAFTYHGLTLSATRRTFARSIEEWLVKTRPASSKNSQCFLLDPVIQLLHIELTPPASYGVPLMWISLSLRDLPALEKIEPAYLRLVLGA